MSFVSARLKGQSISPVKEKRVAAGAAFYRGALLLENASGEWAECGANPALIGAVAESDYQADSTGFGGHGRTEFPPGYMQGTAVQDGAEFHAEYEGALPANPGGNYDVIRSADGKWRVNFASQANARVKYLGPKEAAGTVRRVRCKVLAANVQSV